MLLFLIGYMYSGKTTVANALVRQLRQQGLQASFFDTDSLLEQRYHLTVPDCFRRYGETMFRTLETTVLHDIQDQPDTITVVATGGGTPCHNDNIAWMLSRGTVVCLQPDTATLLTRMAKSHKIRPTIAALPPNQREAFLVSQLRQRQPFYSQAHLTISDTDIPAIVEKIINILPTK